jgi:ATP-binding protein involved in chromosome partitioning
MNKSNGEILARRVSNNIPRIKNAYADIKNIIAVVSGKGGVGKSTTAVNIALAMLKNAQVNLGIDLKIGILDADIYGPSIPTLLGVQKIPQINSDKFMIPLQAHGLVFNSIGLLVDNAPTIWRGPMATGAFNQLLNQTAWDELDYLIIDMPPGTGDIQLTLAQKVPVTAAVVVTTPQTVATLDAQKGLEMLNKVSVYVAGIIENMSMHICSHCGHIDHVFAGDGGNILAEKFNVDILGHLPLNRNIGKYSDSGSPIMVSKQKDDLVIANIYCSIASNIEQKINALKKDTSHLFKVNMEKSNGNNN